jgi:hypothetical protein
MSNVKPQLTAVFEKNHLTNLMGKSDNTGCQKNISAVSASGEIKNLKGREIQYLHQLVERLKT